MKFTFWRILATIATVCLLFFTILVAYRLFYPQRYVYPISDTLSHVVVGNESFIERSTSGEIVLNEIEAVYPSKDGNEIAIFVKDGRRGLINAISGAIVSKPIYDAAWIFTDSVCAVCLSDSVFFLDMNGKRLNNHKYPRELRFDYQYNDGYSIIKIADKYGLIDKSGQWVANPYYDRIDYLGGGAWRLWEANIYQYFFKDNPTVKLPTLISLKKGDTICASSDSVRLYVRHRDLEITHSK